MLAPLGKSFAAADQRPGNAAADITTEGFAEAFAHGQAFGHLIERAGEAPDLVATGRDLDARFKVAALHGFGAADNRADRADEPDGADGCHGQTENGGDDEN